jgi:hypothetical protein
VPKRTLDAKAGDRPVSYDADTEAMLGREQAIWDAWKDRDAKRLDALTPQEIQFIDIFGTHTGLTLYATVDGSCFGEPVTLIWTSSFYVRHGDTWVWSFGINIPAHGGSI